MSGYTSVELPASVPGVGYTLKHRNCVEELIKYYCKRAIGKQVNDSIGEFTKFDYDVMLNRAKCHDMDKLLTGLAYPQLTADYMHRMFNGHHEESMIGNKNKYDFIEMIFDMESAHYTKPDKSGDGNAYLFASKFKPYLMPYLEPWFHFFGLEGIETIPEIKNSVNRKYFESDLIDAIISYIHTTHLHLLDGLSRIDDVGYQRCCGGMPPYRRPLDTNVRPNSVAAMSNSVMSRELVHGTFDAQLFDYDRLCMLRSGDVKSVNSGALNCVKTLVKNNCQR